MLHTITLTSCRVATRLSFSYQLIPHSYGTTPARRNIEHMKTREASKASYNIDREKVKFSHHFLSSCPFPLGMAPGSLFRFFGWRRHCPRHLFLDSLFNYKFKKKGSSWVFKIDKKNIHQICYLALWWLANMGIHACSFWFWVDWFSPTVLYPLRFCKWLLCRCFS